MNQYEAVDKIIQVIPDAKNEMLDALSLRSPYKIIRVFAAEIKHLIEDNNYTVLGKSLDLMDKIYQRGDMMLKNAVENIFIFSLDSFTCSYTGAKRDLIFAKLPVGLYTAYINQIYKSGI